MAISGKISMHGVEFPVYMRIQSATVKAYDADEAGDAQHKILFDVVIHQDKDTRIGDYPNWVEQVRYPSIYHFTCLYDISSVKNVYQQAYEWLTNHLEERELAKDLVDV